MLYEIQQKKIQDGNLFRSKSFLYHIMDLLSLFFLFKILFHPLLDLAKQLQSIINDQEREKSIFIVCIGSLCAMLGIILLESYYPYMQPLSQISIPHYESTKLFALSFNNFLSLLLFSHLGSYVGKLTFHLICKVYLEEPEFYITQRKLKNLEHTLQSQGYPNITSKQLLAIINFCKINFKKTCFTNFLGDKDKDWQKILESIIYKADLEPFIEQQSILFDKLLDLKCTLANVTEYHDSKYHHVSTPRSINTPRSTTSATTIDNPSLNTSSYNAQKRLSISTYENNQIYQCSRSDLTIEEQINLVENEINKFQKSKTIYKNLDRETLINQYTNELYNRSVFMNQNVFPVTMLINMSPSQAKTHKSAFMPVYTKSSHDLSAVLKQQQEHSQTKGAVQSTFNQHITLTTKRIT